MLLTHNEAAKLLNVKETKLRSMVFKREIPFVKIGRLIRFRADDLEKFISDNLKNINN